MRLAQHMTHHVFADRHLSVTLVTACLIASTIACDNTDAVLKQRLKALEATIIYQDLDGLYALHVASLGLDPICATPADRIYLRAAQRAKGDTCDEAAAIINTPSASDTLDDDALMLIEMIHHHCEHPGAPCQDFSKARFKRMATHSRLWTRRVETIAVQRVVHDAQEATAYVDIVYDGHKQPDHVALRLRHIEHSGWMLTSHPW